MTTDGPRIESRGRRRPAIAVVGSMNMDLVTLMPRAPGPGETVIGSAFTTGFGGKGANQAVMAARLGASVSMIARVGDDPYGDQMLTNLRTEGVESTFVEVVAGPSGIASIWVEPDGSNRIIVVPGANGAWQPGAAGEAVRAVAELEVVVGQLEIPQSATAEAFAAARARGATTILNPAPGARLTAPLLDTTDWLVPNDHELATLERTHGGANLDTADAVAISDEGLAAFSARIGKRFLVTLGASGAALVLPNGTVRRLPAGHVAAVDTTGAGDAFVGAFAFGLAVGISELDAVGLAIRCASDSVARPGAQSSFATSESARRFFVELSRR
jgi:ribokinase